MWNGVLQSPTELECIVVVNKDVKELKVWEDHHIVVP